MKAAGVRTARLAVRTDSQSSARGKNSIECSVTLSLCYEPHKELRLRSCESCQCYKPLRRIDLPHTDSIRHMGANHPKGQGTSTSTAISSASNRTTAPSNAARLPTNSTNAQLVNNKSGATAATKSTNSGTPPSVPTAVGVGQPQQATVPVVIRYRVGATKTAPKTPTVHSAEVLVETLGWKSFPLTPSADDFFTIVNLPIGVHGYKFIVNGAEVVDSRQPTRPGTSLQPAANVVTVSEAMLRTRDDAEAADDDTEGWGQNPVIFEETRKLPPVLPPHLRYTPLNTPPTQHRCDEDGHVAAVTNDFALDPEHLPLPLSATINHVYFQRRDDHVVVGVTTRFRNKFTSVAFYRGHNSMSIPARGPI